MRIDSIAIYRNCRPSPDEDRAADHGAGRDKLLVRMASGEHAGWGEIVVGRAPRERPEWAGGIVDVLAAWLGPALVGREIDTPEVLREALAEFAGNPLAKTVLDLAWWDLAARHAGLALWQKLGGEQPRVDVSAYILVQQTPEALLAAVGCALEQGYGLVVLETRPGWDLPMVRGVRQAFPAARLALDFRGSARLEDRDLFYRLDDFELALLEQPLAVDDLVGHAMLQESLRTPVCLSAGIDSLAKLRQAAELGSCRLVRIEPGVVGGLTPAIAMLAECRASGLGCLLGAAGLGPLGIQAVLAMGTLAGMAQGALQLSVQAAPAQSQLHDRCELLVSLPGSAQNMALSVQAPAALGPPTLSSSGSLGYALSPRIGLGIEPTAV